MIRKLFATTAVAALLSMNAYAQDAAPAQPQPTAGQKVDNALDAAGNAMKDAGAAVQDAAQDAGVAVDNAVNNAGQAVDNAGAAINNAGVAVNNAMRTPWDISVGYPIGADDLVVKDLLGAPVYSSAAADAEQIGTVNDRVLSNIGGINAVIVGVGGFLGIGEKNVAVDYLSLQHVAAADNTWRWVLPTTAEALSAAPEFVWVDPQAPAPAAVPAN
ncbi:PRC-barrel domain-containing protein [Devosia sp.]|uniref:PRC-barrel domain-containing protein n=1 Tax=Devosia sp. TaxID=1871048 RepID=UPI0025BFF026|nr:PRC-barrel domain-containing protein [Devosia sp.]